MLKVIWQSYVNQNGVSQLVEQEKFIPEWQLRKIFMHSLSNLRLLSEREHCHYPNPAKTTHNENGEIIDFYQPPPDPPEPELPLSETEKKAWIEKIKEMKAHGYTDAEIIRLLRPIAMTTKNRHNGSDSEPPKQGELF
ncbi:MAG: hypothetical protein NZ826_02220 [Thermodesulfovibrio sp.]|nr:hypothetical protein [Thermodesulfovibrio sp.]